LKVKVSVRIEEEIVEKIKKIVDNINKRHSGVTLSSYIQDVLRDAIKKDWRKK